MPRNRTDWSVNSISWRVNNISINRRTSREITGGKQCKLDFNDEINFCDNLNNLFTTILRRKQSNTLPSSPNLSNFSCAEKRSIILFGSMSKKASSMLRTSIIGSCKAQVKKTLAANIFSLNNLYKRLNEQLPRRSKRRGSWLVTNCKRIKFSKVSATNFSSDPKIQQP
uniref:Uncharacterized protein n=1 Tax=Romanomermis culicivorax TaxID=13658 RepID=A0A915IRP9_ROMCU